MIDVVAIGATAGMVVLAVALLLSTRANNAIAPKLVASAEREGEAIKARDEAQRQRDAAVVDASTSGARARVAEQRLAEIEAVVAAFRAKEVDHAVDKVASARDAAAAWAAVGQLFEAYAVPHVPGAGPAAAEGHRDTTPAVQPAGEAGAAGHGREAGRA